MNEARERAARPNSAAHDGASGLERWAPLLSALVAVVLTAWKIPGARDFCLDDAWIHLSYARNLRDGWGPSYNPGDWETGVSSPLWVALLAIWPFQRANPVPSVMGLGVLLHAATACVAAALAAHVARGRASVAYPVPVAAASLLCGVLVASTPPLVQGATSGMEVPLAALLAVSATWMVSTGRAWGAAALGVAAMWARPECGLFIAPLAVVGALTAQRRAAVAAGLGAVVGQLVWCGASLAISGWPFPNTRYVKADGGSIEGLRYVWEELLPTQPWLVSIGGAALLVLSLWHERKQGRSELLGLFFAWVVAITAIAVSRPLHPGVGFFETRYFAPVAWVPALVIALALVERRVIMLCVAAAPLSLVVPLQLFDTAATERAQQRSVRLLHRAPAEWIEANLPPSAVIAVEGAGASRYFTDRRKTIVDVLGLNDGEIAHAPDDRAKVCVILRRAPDYMLLPDALIGPLSRVFVLEPIESFFEPAFAQVDPPHPVTVVLFRVTGARAPWCGGDDPPPLDETPGR